MSRTKTGDLPIGFRYAPLSNWSQDIQGLVTWAQENGFSASIPAEVLKTLPKSPLPDYVPARLTF